MRATGDGGDHTNLLNAVERRLEPRATSRVLTVEVDVDQAAQLAALVQKQVGDRERLERLAERRASDFELPLTAGLLGD